MGVRRNLIRLSGMVLLLLGFLLVLATPASASPMIPGVPDCKDAPMAQLPGDGLTGFLDSKPNPLPPQGDPFAKNPSTSVYEQYGYAGLTWHTYDLGCGGDIRDINASSDTMIGNATLAFATWGVAATNGLHNKIAHPADYMAPLDDVVSTVSARIKDAIWGPWGRGAAQLGGGTTCHQAGAALRLSGESRERQVARRWNVPRQRRRVGRCIAFPDQLRWPLLARTSRRASTCSRGRLRDWRSRRRRTADRPPKGLRAVAPDPANRLAR
jgi:hypothetical protein